MYYVEIETLNKTYSDNFETFNLALSETENAAHNLFSEGLKSIKIFESHNCLYKHIASLRIIF